MSKTLAIFGFGPGLALGAARRFGREGFRIAAIGRAPSASLIEELTAAGITAEAFTADLTREAELLRATHAITDRFGRIDVAVHTAAADMSARSASTLDIDVDALRAPLELKLYSPIWMTRALAPAMIERGEGTLLYSSGLSEQHLQPYLANFGVVMAAQRAYIRQLDAELRGTGVHVGLLNVGVLIGGSKAQQIIDANPELIPPGLEINRLSNDELAEQYWRMYTDRDRAERDIGFDIEPDIAYAD
ncbi:SDR family NAD(P)-dependent oxidoreductase [Nocardia bovistercoris]|uniref:SDR family oxidoreductase n=1 Tax=Nocardia bovistercoris TaxID=2785916 RepID=A0A931IEC9_9NOCA|nr:SDR family oxidoreductase [Nocardia bovistercoris]MBH0778993.1 SDR family oxidoreductase [Nocardia bovistercoris]